jgi:hypothetical protein
MRISAEGITDRVVDKQPLIGARDRGISTVRDWVGRTASAAPRTTKHPKEDKQMAMMRNLKVAAVGVLLLGLSQGALAQQSAQPQPDEAKAQAMEDIQLTRTAIAAERQALTTRGMELTPEEMQGFWPLYRQYRLEAAKVGYRIVALIATYTENCESLTDATADKLLNEFVNIEKERAHLKAKYLPKFKKVLPPKKVARFFQLENKLDILILAEMAEQIPLVR